jgi:LEA14-like dessication related protein
MAVAAVACAALAACSSLGGNLEPPNLSVVNVEMQQGSLFEQRFKVRLRVQNPNDRELPVKGITAAMTVNGEKFANGVSGSAFTVPAFGEAEFDMLMSANVASTVLRLASSAQGGKAPESLDYAITGKVSLSSGVVRSIPFEDKGTFKLGQ